MNNQEFNPNILSRIAADLQREIIRQTNEVVINDLELQIEALKSFKKEIEDFRVIKKILNNNE